MKSDSSKPINAAGTASALRWSAVSMYGAQAMQVAASIIVARILAPEHFGLLGMAAAFAGLVKNCGNLGFGAVLVQRDIISDRLISTLFWANVAVCACLAGAMLLCAPLVGWVYSEPQVTSIVMVLSLSVLMTAFTMTPQFMLQRRLAFKSLAIREIGGVLVSGVLCIILALYGWGVWALVMAELASVLTRVLLLNVLCPVPVRLVFDFGELRDSLKFGLNVTGLNLLSYASRNADNFIIGIFLGPVALGYYSFAYRIMLMPRDAITRVVTRVLFPTFARLQNDDATLSSKYFAAVSGIAFLTFPMMGGIVVLSDKAVEYVLGEKWLPAVPIIFVLGATGAIQSLWGVCNQVMLAKGESGALLKWSTTNAVASTVSYFVGIPFGVIGVATAYAITSAVSSIGLFWTLSLHVKGLTLRRTLRTIAQPAALTVAMMLIVLMVSESLDQYPRPVGLICSVVVGIVVYFALAYISRCEGLSLFSRLVPARFIAIPASLLGTVKK